MVDVLRAPVVGREHDLGLHAARCVGNPHHGREPLKRLFADARGFLLPVDRGAVGGRFRVRGRQQHIERAVALRCERRVDAARVADIERRVVGQATLADVGEILPVLRRGVDRVVRKIDLALHAEVQHEGAARVALRVERGVLLVAAAQVRWNQVLHRPGRVCVDDDMVEAPLLAVDDDAARALTLEHHPRNRARRLDARAKTRARLRHRCDERVAAADRMPHAVLVLDERQDREQARALERAHAEVLRLETHRETRFVALEVAGELRVHRLPRPQHRRDLERVEVHEIREPADRASQDRLHERELLAVVCDEAEERIAVAWLNRVQAGGHLLKVAGRVDLRGLGAALIADEKPVHRIEPLHLDEVARRHADRPEDLLEHIRHHEEGRAAVEGVGAGLEAAGAASDNRLRLEDGDIDARSREEHGHGEAAGTSANDRHGCALGGVRARGRAWIWRDHGRRFGTGRGVDSGRIAKVHAIAKFPQSGESSKCKNANPARSLSTPS